MNTQQEKIKQWRSAAKQLLLLIALVAPVLGAIDTGYLTAKHYSGAALTCGVFNGCDTVTTSAYSTMFGIPLALLGFGYYLALTALIIAYAIKKDTRYLYAVAAISGAGLIFSLWLVYLQLFVIKALCSYCLFSVAVTAMIVAVSATMIKRHSTIPHEQTTPLV